MTFWKWNDNLIVLFELWRSLLKMDMFYLKNWPCDVIKLTIFLIFFVVSYRQRNVLTGHHCILEIIWSVISWYLSYHLSFQKNIRVLNFFLCIYNVSSTHYLAPTFQISAKQIDFIVNGGQLRLHIWSQRRRLKFT